MRTLETFEIGAQFRCRLAAHVAIFFESFADDFFELGGKLRERGESAAVGWRLRIASVTTAEVSPRKGRMPVAIS